MKTTTEIRLFELLKAKFTEEDSRELVSEIKSLTNDDLLTRMDDKLTGAKADIISSLTWRLLFFFIAQVGFTITLIKLMG